MKLTVTYDGRAFAGSQRQGNRRTVQLELERSLAILWKRDNVSTVFAGRTDAGVHAAGQVVSVNDGRPDLEDGQLVRALNANLPADLAVQAAERLPGPFHARYDAAWREYRYRLWSGVRQPLVNGVVLQRAQRFDIDRMRRAVTGLVGTHDLASFAGGGEGVPGAGRIDGTRGTVRTVFHSSVRRMPIWWKAGTGEGELIEFRIVADGFLPRMVRNVVGALLDVGRGVRPESWINDLLDARDRRCAGPMAPAEGLTLWRVGYGDDSFHD